MLLSALLREMPSSSACMSVAWQPLNMLRGCWRALRALAMHQVKRFIPFSIGPRDCIGQNLAKVNYQTTVPMLLSQFSFKLAEEVLGFSTA